MSENTKIQWTHATFNPWSGCSKVSPGCANCYAEVNYSVKMRGVKWGPNGNRIVKAESGWKEPLLWDKHAAEGRCRPCNGKGYTTVSMTDDKEGYPACDQCNGTGKVAPYRLRVFCASLGDVFEDWQGPMMTASSPQQKADCHECGTKDAKVLAATDGQRIGFNEHLGTWKGIGRDLDKHPLNKWRWATMSDIRARLFRLIDATPNLDWLVLSKRPENITKMMPAAPESGENYHVTGSIGALRLDVYRKNLWLGTSVENQEQINRIDELLKVPAAVHWISAEPLLGPLDLSKYLFSDYDRYCIDDRFGVPANANRSKLSWVVVGGESGPGARPCRLEWMRDIVQQCKAAGVACFSKQLGSQPYEIIQNQLAEAIGWGDKPPEKAHYESRTLKLHDKKGGD
ncbi:MAG TPA: DUF5131 family protein, partial [Candidatus Binatus sp.]|nr:DUF5131 family protein [Candidatus Binatus sp.]